MNKYFYITTTLPYINDEPHIGFAMEIIRADAFARFYRLLGYKVFFSTGTDEHGLKIYQRAQQLKIPAKIYCDQYAQKFKDLKTLLNLSYDRFIRTTDDDHIKASQEFWRRCLKNGDIYKGRYRVRYCVGCEMEKSDSELKDNRCLFHPNRPLEIIEEENYFFRFSRYQKKLLDFYQKNPDFVQPNFRQKEIVEFVQKGLKDFSISRIKSKMPWGIDVPNDPQQVIYVWFDALINYISTLGWPNNIKNFNHYWPGIQVAGKDNLRQQAAMWQAMLFSAGLKPSKKIYIEGFINVEGQKMSKSLGNVISPFDLVKKYGIDAVRYYLLREVPSFDDGNFSYSRMNQLYQSELANELGNLLSRLTNLGQKDKLKIDANPQPKLFTKKIIDSLNRFQFNAILEDIWKEIKNLNKKIDSFAPWNKEEIQRKKFLIQSLQSLRNIAIQLQPFLPKTAEKIISACRGQIKKIPPLFPRLK